MADWYEAILLHEIAHYEHGDALIAGEGSLLQKMLDVWFPLFLLICFGPLVILWGDQAVTFVQSSSRLGSPLPLLLLHEFVNLLVIFVPGWFLILIEEFLHTASFFLLPLAAVWCIELNADQAVLQTMHPTDTLLQALGQFHVSTGWQEGLFAYAAHPPKRLRQWVIQNMDKKGSVLLLLLVFPLAIFFLLLDVLPTFLVQVSSEQVFPGHTDLGRSLAIDVGAVLGTAAPIWGVSMIVLLVWPFVQSFWVQKMSSSQKGDPLEKSPAIWAHAQGYFLCAGLTAIFVLWSSALYVLTR